MKSQGNLQIASATIGEPLQVTATPDIGGQVIYKEFGVPTTEPLSGSTKLSSFIAELEFEPAMAERLNNARRALASAIGEAETFRHLRLSAGLSQDRLAALASTTQTYVARLESGTVDPGTDMLARLAAALGTSEVAVFSAVRAQRKSQVEARVG